MTLPASGAISFNAINVELGKSGTTQGALNDTDYRTLAAVPSGQISLSSFYGKSAVTYSASLSNDTVWDLAISPTDAFAGIRVHSDGTVDNRTNVSANYTNQYTWLTGAGSTNADYEVRWTTTAGTLSAGTAGTWMVLSTSREFTRNETRNGFFSSSCTGTLEIRMAASPFTVLATATITLQADVEI